MQLHAVRSNTDDLNPPKVALYMYHKSLKRRKKKEEKYSIGIFSRTQGHTHIRFVVVQGQRELTKGNLNQLPMQPPPPRNIMFLSTANATKPQKYHFFHLTLSHTHVNAKVKKI